MKQVKISRVLFSIILVAGMLFMLGGCGSSGGGGGTTTPASGEPDAVPGSGDPGVTPATEDPDVTPSPVDAGPAAAARQWGIPSAIETVLLQSQWDSSGENSNARAFSMTSGGDAMVVWPQGNITDESIYAARYTAGSGWGAPVLIETGTGVAGSPRVAMNENRDAVAVWFQNDGTRGRIFANRYSAGNWGTAVAIDSGTGNYLSAPQVVIDASGNAIAIWSESNGVARSLYANRYTATGWGSAMLLETDNANQVVGETIAMNASGDAIAAWSVIPVGGSTYTDIFAVRFSPAGGWTVPVTLNVQTLGMYSPPSLTIALDDNADGMAVWNQREGGTVINVVSRSYKSGGWGSVQTVSGATYNAFDPYVSGNSAGTYVVIYLQDDGTGSNTYDIYANRYTGSGWGAPQLIETGSGTAGIKPNVAMNSSGAATAVWGQSDGSRYNLWANTMDATGVWGTAQQIEAFDSGGVANYKAAMDVNGNAMAVWAQASGSYTQIYYNRYE